MPDKLTVSLLYTYIGNYVNTLFGILQQCLRAFMTDAFNESNWIVANFSEGLSKLAAIDNGRYV
jgi:hypothetical protein